LAGTNRVIVQFSTGWTRISHLACSVEPTFYSKAKASVVGEDDDGGAPTRCVRSGRMIREV